MTLLSRDEVNEIRERMSANASTAEDVRRLLADLADGPPRIFIAPAGASNEARAKELRGLAAVHRGAVYVLPYGWIESNTEQRDAFERGLRHVAHGARRECAAEIRAILDENRLNPAGAVCEIGELAARLDPDPPLLSDIREQIAKQRAIRDAPEGVPLVLDPKGETR